jgi:hypothetical protein
MPEQRPPPWTVEEPDAKLQQQLLHRPRRQWPRAGLRLFRGRAGRRAAAELLTRDEARRIAANVGQAAGAARLVPANLLC